MAAWIPAQLALTGDLCSENLKVGMYVGFGVQGGGFWLQDTRSGE